MTKIKRKVKLENDKNYLQATHLNTLKNNFNVDSLEKVIKKNL